MKKIILLLCIVVLFAGCSKDNEKDTMSNPEEQITGYDYSDAEHKDDNTGSSPVDQKTDQGSKDPSEPVSNPSGKDPIVPTISEVFREGEVIEYTGAVGDAKIHMTLKYQNNQLIGTYYYDKYRTEIGLTGSMENIYLDHPSFILTENTDQQGLFIGLYINDDIVEGCWKTWNKLYPMYLIRTGSKSNPPKAPESTILELDGEWYGKNSSYFNGSDMTIKVLFDDLLYFDLSAYNGTATGALAGLASYREGAARVTFLDHIIWDDPKSDHVSFEFRKNTNEISLISNQYNYYCGMGVSFDDTYTGDKINVKSPSLMEVGIVDTKEQEELFIKMVNYSDYSFIQNTQSVMYEDILLDGKKVRAGASYLRGASGMCYYINASDYMYAAIYEEGGIQYYTNDPNYADHMPKPMQEWAESFGTEIIYNNISAPYPFDSKLPDLLVNQREQMKKDKEIKLPANYSLRDYSFGDLNKDGQEDFAVLIEQGSGEFTGSRKIYLFLNQKGKYELTFENNSIVLGSMEGGPFGDPFEEISLSEGEFYVQDYGGSSDRWGHTYTFTYQNNKLILTNIVVVGHNTFSLNGSIDTYDLMNKTAETRTMYEPGEEDSTGKDYNNLLIYKGRIKLTGDITFEKATAWCEEDLSLEPECPMPSLWDYEYGQHDYSGARFTAERILDKVMKKYYPGMKKVTIPFSEEIQDNYSSLLAYEVPGYYYSDGKNVLYYYEMRTVEESNRILHTVHYNPLDDEQRSDNEFFDYWDDTGEEKQ